MKLVALVPVGAFSVMDENPQQHGVSVNCSEVVSMVLACKVVTPAHVSSVCGIAYISQRYNADWPCKQVDSYSRFSPMPIHAPRIKRTFFFATAHQIRELSKDPKFGLQDGCKMRRRKPACSSLLSPLFWHHRSPERTKLLRTYLELAKVLGARCPHQDDFSAPHLTTFQRTVVMGVRTRENLSIKISVVMEERYQVAGISTCSLTTVGVRTPMTPTTKEILYDSHLHV
ncbi:hypothetical protein Hamer_G003919 [Homarus americanus]|uniref:Uncharacterized protein n=1 Tax=Homarus americanus TaxID=6706 RepID=A0A8J5TW17_HOMAM|nr:hypothetical protein Hamer_G003919 [Homarus americanus]